MAKITNEKELLEAYEKYPGLKDDVITSLRGQTSIDNQITIANARLEVDSRYASPSTNSNGTGNSAVATQNVKRSALAAEGITDTNSDSASNDFNKPFAYDLKGGMVHDVSNDYLLQSKYQKYNNTKILHPMQPFHMSTPGMRKIVNFKQDYIVIIRKKAFYWANCHNNMVALTDNNDIGTIGDGTYIRSYRLDNFVSISMNHSIMSMGSCNVQIKGAEYVPVYEEKNQLSNSNILKAVKGQTTVDKVNAMNGANDKLGSLVLSNGIKVDKDLLKNADKTQAWKKDAAGNQYRDSKMSYADVLSEEEYKQLLQKDNRYEGSTINKHVEYMNGQILTVTATVTDKEGKLIETSCVRVPVKNQKVDALELDKRIAEKCDFEPMDEIWVWGKSNFEREFGKEFKYNQIFFGYLNSVQKNYQSGRSNGNMITLAASDQLKLLSLSYITLRPSMIPGAAGAGGLDLRFSFQDLKHFGTFEVYDPLVIYNVLGGSTEVEDATKAQKELMGNIQRSFTLTNILAGIPIYKIIVDMCLDAGIPTWYLSDRIERILWAPFTYNVGNLAGDALMQAPQMAKRLDQCQNAARKLELEFFADEEGNIVLKCPNYALGVNRKTKNNMGLTQLDGSLLGNNNLIASIMTAKNTTDETMQKQVAEDLKQQEKQFADAHKKEIEEVKKKIKDDVTLLYDEKYPLTDEQMQLMTSLEAHRLGKQYNNNYGMAAATHAGSIETQQVSSYIQSNVNSSLDGNYNNVLNKDNEEGNSNTSKSIPLDGTKSLLETIQECKIRYNETTTEEQLYNKIVQSNANSWIKEIYPAGLTHGKEQADKYPQYKDKILYVDFNLAGTDSNAAYEEDFAKMVDSRAQQMVAQDIGASYRTEDYYNFRARKLWNHTLSEYTDALIPEIPQEYIQSFTLSDQDNEIYNMYQVNIEGDWGIGDSKANANALANSRVFPDIKCMLKFGCRPGPQTMQIPYMGNREMAHMLGYMKCAISLSRRNSASINMVEDSFIRIGNPIRFFAYDEHPDHPRYPQLDESKTSSALNVLNKYARDKSSTGETLDSASIAIYGEINPQVKDIYYRKETPTGKIIEVQGSSSEGTDVTNGNIHLNDGATHKGNSATQQINTNQQGKPASAENPKTTIGTIANGTPQAVVDPNQQKSSSEKDVDITDSSNWIGQAVADATDSDSKNKQTTVADTEIEKLPFTLAKDAVTKTNAQSIYYVESISRNISPTNLSSMTLNLTCGRMMGTQSNIDLLLLLYKPYYDFSVGFSADLIEINAIKNKYVGKTKELPLNSDNADFTVILKKEYEIEFSGQKTSIENEEENKEDVSKLPEKAVKRLKAETTGTEQQAHTLACEMDWMYLTEIKTGHMYHMKEMANGSVSPEALYEFKYYIYDTMPTRWVYVGKILPIDDEDSVIKSDGTTIEQHCQTRANRLIEWTKINGRTDFKNGNDTNTNGEELVDGIYSKNDVDFLMSEQGGSKTKEQAIEILKTHPKYKDKVAQLEAEQQQNNNPEQGKEPSTPAESQPSTPAESQPNTPAESQPVQQDPRADIKNNNVERTTVDNTCTLKVKGDTMATARRTAQLHAQQAFGTKSVKCQYIKKIEGSDFWESVWIKK